MTTPDGMAKRSLYIGASEVRSFLRGRYDGDTGRYVSAGAFRKDAYYEDDGGKIALVPMKLEVLVPDILGNYNDLHDKTKALIPLTR